ncbi:mediator of RNA polymerase II transcription subunit 8 isoform X2 [Brassica napus]|uniref:mediator of RNA polymerase II transcription subunit 8 isoform X2 n=1 Tax=Brassica napus TaxID=3708 RepID=UPI0006AA6257|nr:mediator of RNA polymerase II transcription subunit 8 isoform X2 [Brassica napus]
MSTELDSDELVGNNHEEHIAFLRVTRNQSPIRRIHHFSDLSISPLYSPILPIQSKLLYRTRVREPLRRSMDTATQPPQGQPPPVAEKLNPELVQLLNLESVKTRADSLFKAISRILEDFDAYGRTNTSPKWQDILGQYSMVNLELFNIVEEVKKVSKAFVVLPKNVNAENAQILPVMLSSKLLPEMEADDNVKREQLLQGVQNLPVPMQIEKLKERMTLIAQACENAEKTLADTRKAYGFGARQGPSMLPTMDKVQVAKIQEQESMLRAAVNDGAGTRLPPDQRQITTALPPHLVDVLFVNDAGKNALPVASNNINSQGNMMQVSGTQFMGRSAASPSNANFDTTRSPLPYSNSPQSAGMLNAPSPQQQQQLQQQQRSKLMQLPQHQQQLLAQQQQLRQSSMQQSQMPSLHDLQAQQKFQSLHGQQHQMPYSQSMGHQQYQARQLSGGHIQHGMSQGQLNPAMLNRQLNQFSGGANSAMFTSAQGSPSSQMIPNMSSMQSQTLNPRMQYGVSGTNAQRGHASQMLGDQMFNNSGMMQTQQSQQPQQQQQQQQQQQGAYGNMQTNQQNLQPNMLQNPQQRHQNPQ